MGIEFSAVQRRLFLLWVSVVREAAYKDELFEIVEQNLFEFNDLNLSKGPAALKSELKISVCVYL